jgi:hypothetical protein
MESSTTGTSSNALSQASTGESYGPCAIHRSICNRSLISQCTLVQDIPNLVTHRREILPADTPDT